MWDEHAVGGRPLYVWAPDDRSRDYPTVYVLHSFMRSARSWFNVEPFERSYPEEIEDAAPRAIVALVDGRTDLGGGQWVGGHARHLCDEVVPFVEERYPSNGMRALQGKSSGGYGAIVNALARPDLFHAVAAHAPDALFGVTLTHDFPAAARAIRAGREDDIHARVVRSLAHAFSDGELPFDLETCELVPEVWERWLVRDPIALVRSEQDAVRRLRGVWLDVGDADEYNADLGVRALRRELLAAGLDEERLRFEIFPGGHRGLSWRYPLSLDWLVGALSITF